MYIDLNTIFNLLWPPIIQGIVTGLVITLMAKLRMFPAVAFFIKEEDI